MPNHIIWRWWFMHEEDKSKGSTFPHWILQLNSRLNIQSNWRKKKIHSIKRTTRYVVVLVTITRYLKKPKKHCPEIVYNYFCLKKKQRDKSRFMRQTYLSICFLKKCILKFKSKYIFKANNKIAYNFDILS